MTNFKHLTQFELIAYHGDSLEKNERHEIGKHLLNCAECRKRLPMPSVERFWAAIMTDSEVQDSPQKEDTERFLPALASFLKLQSALLWSGAALLIIFCFTFLLWSGSADSSREVVQTFDNESVSDRSFPLPAQTPIEKDSIVLTNSNRASSNPTPKTNKQEVSKREIVRTDSRPDFKVPNLKPQPKQQVVATRGVSAKCSENQKIDVEFSGEKENFVFKWKAFPKAAKYHLYISDEDEILVDEFETEAETTFVLRKPLDPQKTYKWKIIVTLENGQTVIGNSQKFTMKDFQMKQRRIEPRRNSETRCSEDG